MGCCMANIYSGINTKSHGVHSFLSSTYLAFKIPTSTLDNARALSRPFILLHGYGFVPCHQITIVILRGLALQVL